MSLRCLVMLAVAGVLYFSGCSGGSSIDTPTIRLVDHFKADSISNSPKSAASEPAVSWNFAKPATSNTADAAKAPSDGAKSSPVAKAATPLMGWKAGVGVTDLKIVDGHLTGHTTTDFPLIYAPLPAGIDPDDDFHSVDVRVRSSAAGELAVIRSNDAELDFKRIIDQNTRNPPALLAKVAAGMAFQTLAITATRPGTMAGKNLLIRPVNVEDATFDIESVRVLSQDDHRAMVPTGLGWMGLDGIYRESIVSRSPEVFSIDADIPSSAHLDVNIGTTEPAPMAFKITASSGGEEQTLLERTVTTPHRWEPLSIDLSRLAGKKTLRFSLAIDQDRRIGIWGNPIIRFSNAPRPKTEAAAAALGGADAPQRVIFFMCDTLRRDHLNMYGYDRVTAPNLAKLAEQSTLFLDNISQATWTKASTPSLMTSLYPSSTRVAGVPDRLSASATTIAEVFRDAGFTTVSFSSTAFTGRLTNLHQGFEELHESASIDAPTYRSKTARAYVDNALDWIEHHSDTPFFMYLHVFDPHHQYEPRAPYATAFNDPAMREEHEKERETARKFTNEDMRGRGLPNPAELKAAGVEADKWVKYERDWYDASILGMDVEVGRLLERLRALGLEQSTLLVFFSDHGEGFGDHGSMWHGYTGYGEMSGVPMLFHRPGVVPGGLKISETVRNLDLMPTVLDLSGLKIPEKVQGQSLVPLMAAASQSAQGKAKGSVTDIAAGLGWKPQPAVTEKSDDKQGERPKGLLSYAIISDGWKLVHNEKRPDERPEYELYHHAEDPLDKTNVLDQHADIAQGLKTKLAEWHKMVEAGKLPEGESTEGVSEKELERLKSLGYVQ